MSTILQALQKSKFDHAGGPPPIAQQATKILSWKVVISSALAIIIVLLSTLVYLLLNPRSESLPTIVSSELAQPANNNLLTKVTFETKKLPAPAPKAKKAIAVKQVPKEPEIIVAPKKPIQKEQSVDLEDVPSDLQKRFELALILTDIEQNEIPTEEFTQEEGMNDGSDIRQMSSAFQNKVPFIRYDSHMYSSIVAKRWIRINGETLTEGDFDSTGQLELIEIQPQRSIFRLERQSFSVESLTDWKGY